MTLLELKEQIQNDLITMLEEDVSPQMMDAICQIVVDNFSKFEQGNS